MKFRALAAVAVSSLIIASCGEATQEPAVETENAVSEVSTAAVVTFKAEEKSKVNWRGEVAGVYGHEGYVHLDNGTLEVQGDKIIGGTFVVDMTNIIPTDSSYEYSEQSNPDVLVGHLSTEDFFHTGEHPTSTFVITGVDGNTVTGNLTVRGNTNEETMTLEEFRTEGDEVMMTGKMVFNRQNYDVSWVHFMKDMILSDDISITYSLVAKKS
jgi:polyisoprenoid-binding protein YceI